MRAWIFVLLCNLLWAGNFISGKFAVQEFSPLWITFLRWIIAVAILFPVAARWEKHSYGAIPPKTWLQLAGMGLFGVVAFNLLIYSALQYTSPLNGTLISALTPAMAMLLTAVVMRERIGGRQFSGLLLALAGVIVTLTRGHVDQVFTMTYNRGDLLMLAADLAWVLYTVIGKQVSQVPPITATALSSAFGLVMMLPFAILQPLAWDKVTGAGLASILYIALGASVLAFTLWNMAVRTLGINKASVSINLIPIYTALITLLLGQPFYAAQLWGGLLVISGLLIIAKPKKKEPAKADSSSQPAIVEAN